MDFDPSTATAVEEPKAQPTFDPASAVPVDSSPSVAPKARTPPKVDWNVAYQGMEGLSEQDRNARIKATNQAYAQSKRGTVPMEQISHNWELYKSSIANTEFGLERKPMSDEAFSKAVIVHEKSGMGDAVMNARLVASRSAPERFIAMAAWLTKYGPEVGIKNAEGVISNDQTFGGTPLIVANRVEGKKFQPAIFITAAHVNPALAAMYLHDPEIINGVYNAIAPRLSAMTSPNQLVMLGAGSELKLLSEAYPLAKTALTSMTGLFAGIMGKQVVEGVGAAKNVLTDPKATKQQKVEAVTGVVADSIMTLGAAFATAHEAMPSPEQAALTKFMKGRTPEQVAPVLRVIAENAAPEDAPAMEAAATEMEKIAPPAPTGGDYARYQEIQAKIRAHVQDAIANKTEIDTPEYQALWAESEAIKNRNPESVGMPPGAVAAEPKVEPVDIGPRDKHISTGSGEPTSAEQEMLTNWAESISKETGIELPKIESGQSIGIENASVDAELKAMGVDPAEHGAKVTRQGLLDDALAKMKEDPDSGKKLIATLETRTEPATAQEGVLLAVETNRLRLERDSAQANLISARKAGDAEAIASAELRVAETRDAFVRAEKLSTKTGTANAQALAMRAVMLKEDYSLAKLEADRMAANPKGELTPEAAKEVAEIRAKLDAAEKKYEDYKARASQLLMEDEPASRKAGRGTPPGKVMSFISQRAKEARARISARMAEGRLQAGLDPIDIADHVIVGAEYFAKGVNKFGEWSAAMVKEFGERLTPHLAAIFDAAKEQVTTHRRLIAAEAAADRQIANLEEQIKNEAPFSTTRTKGPTNATIEAKRARVADLEEIRAGIRDRLQGKPEPEATIPRTREEITHAQRKTRMEKQIKEWERRIDQNDFQPKAKEVLPFDAEEQRLKADIERVRRIADLGRLKEENANRSIPEKVAAGFAGFVRFNVLSWPTIISKLGAFSLTRPLTRPLQSIASLGYSKIMPELATKASGEGVTSFLSETIEAGGKRQVAPGFVRIEAKALAAAFTKGLREFKNIISLKGSTYSALYDKTKLPYTKLQWVSALHEALHIPSRMNEFERQYQTRIANAIRAGIDPTNEFVKAKLESEAWHASGQAAYVQDNVVANAWQSGIRALEAKNKTTGKKSGPAMTAAALLRGWEPITKVPVNIASEALFEASPLGLARGAWDAIRGATNNFEGMNDAEADQVLRHLSKGTVGTAFFVLGWYNRDKIGGLFIKGEKRKQTEAKPGEIKTSEGMVPASILHNTYMEQANIGASLGRLAMSPFKRMDSADQNAVGNVMAVAMGAAERVPMFDIARDLDKLSDPKQAEAILAKKTAMFLIPGFSEWIARQTDKKNWFSLTEAPQPRKPTTLKQEIEVKIPGLRENVPIKRNTFSLRP